MTSPITPESRAKLLCDALHATATFKGENGKWVTARGLIAQAIRDAENDALEGAAAWFEDQIAATKKLIATMGPSEFTSSTFKILEAVPADIRSLKTKET